MNVMKLITVALAARGSEPGAGSVNHRTVGSKMEQDGLRPARWRTRQERGREARFRIAGWVHEQDANHVTRRASGEYKQRVLPISSIRGVHGEPTESPNFQRLRAFAFNGK